jgi:predicted secreted protein
MVTIKINNYEYPIPTKWEEVTLRQYIELATYIYDINHIRMLSIMTGLDYDVLCNFPCDDFQLKVIPEMNFLSEELDVLSIKRASKLHIGDFIFDVIRDPSKERLGQKLFMQQITESAVQNKLPHHTLIAPVIANYYAPFVHPDKKWEEQHIKEFEQLVLDMPLMEAYPEADFFLTGYLTYSRKK